MLKCVLYSRSQTVPFLLTRDTNHCQEKNVSHTGLDLPPRMRQLVKTQNPMNGELSLGLLQRSPVPSKFGNTYSVLSVDAYNKDRAGDLSDLTARKSCSWLLPNNCIAFMTAGT